MEPVIIQYHMKKLRLVNLEADYVRLNDGDSMDDSGNDTHIKSTCNKLVIF